MGKLISFTKNGCLIFFEIYDLLFVCITLVSQLVGLQMSATMPSSTYFCNFEDKTKSFAQANK